MRVEALGAEFAIEALDEGVVRRFPGPREVEYDAPLVGPKVEILGNELRALVDANGLRAANFAANTIERRNYIGSLIRPSHLNRRHEARVRVDQRLVDPRA